MGCGREAIVIDSMGEPQRGYNHPHRANIIKKSLAALFSFIPIEQPFEQWSRAAQAKFVPTRVAIANGNKRLVNGMPPKGATTLL